MPSPPEDDRPVQNKPVDNKIDDAGMGDLSERLKELSARINAEKRDQAVKSKVPASYGDATGYAKAYRLMAEFVAGILMGALVGFGIDWLLGSSPFGLMIFTLLGFGAGIMNMARAANKVPPALDRLKPGARPEKVGADETEDKED